MSQNEVVSFQKRKSNQIQGTVQKQKQDYLINSPNIQFKNNQSKGFSNDLNQLRHTKQQIKNKNYQSNNKYKTHSQIVSISRGKRNQIRREQMYHQTLEDLMITSKRQKIPSLLKKTLHEQAVNNGRYKKKESIQKTKFGQMISLKLKRQIQQCEICMSQMQKNQKTKISDCNHFFCTNCLNQYVLYKVLMFQEITCPNEQCQKIIDQQNDFYKSLPQDTKTKYIKIHNFYQTSKDSSLRLCPKQNCEGVIKVTQNQPIICNKCSTQFCPKCYFQMHEGLCDQNQLNFFQNNLHYRQCSNCKFVVQKNQGCNHMTCICKHQFCYVCGDNWSHDHLCNRPPQGLVPIQNQEARNCCNCNCVDGCDILRCILFFIL